MYSQNQLTKALRVPVSILTSCSWPCWESKGKSLSLVVMYLVTIDVHLSTIFKNYSPQIHIKKVPNWVKRKEEKGRSSSFTNFSMKYSTFQIPDWRHWACTLFPTVISYWNSTSCEIYCTWEDWPHKKGPIQSRNRHFAGVIYLDPQFPAFEHDFAA